MPLLTTLLGLGCMLVLLAVVAPRTPTPSPRGSATLKGMDRIMETLGWILLPQVICLVQNGSLIDLFSPGL